MIKTIALLLVLVLLVPCLSACHIQFPQFSQTTAPTEEDENSCIADQPKTVSDPLHISDILQAVLDNSVIFSPGSPWACAMGVKSALEGPLPTYVEDILMLPALALARFLGAECTQNGSDHRISLGGVTVALTPGSSQLYIGDTTVALPIEVTPEKGDLLVSAQELCSALGQSVAIRNDLIFVGPNVSAVETDESNGMELIGSALSSELSYQDTEIAALGAVSTGDGYFARADRSACLVLTADMIPYTAANGETIAIAGSLYVEDLMVEPSASRDDYYSCSMTVYNVGYTYGSVEAFDKDDNLIEFEKVKPFEGQKASVTKALTDMVVLGTDIYQAIDQGSWAELDYRSSLNSSKVSIRLEVPKDGYIFVTCNPMHSERVAVYNAVHTFLTLASFAQDLVKSDNSATIREQITDQLCEKIFGNANTVAELSMEFAALFSNISVTPTNPSGYAKEVGQKLLERFQRCDFDIKGALQDTVKEFGTDQADKAAEKYLTKLLPATQVAFTAWDISYTSANVVCLFMDLAYCTKTRSVIIEIGDWRAAYAQLLRERGNKGGERFVLGYVNGDGIPDLMVTYAFSHFGSYAEFYTYQQRQVHPIKDEHGNQQLGVAYGTFFYAEFHSVLMRGNLHMGISSTNYMHIIDNVITSTEVFYDTAQSGMGSEYYYNDEQVSKVYYNWKLNSFVKEYEPYMKRVEGGSDGWSISEENIQEVLKR